MLGLQHAAVTPLMSSLAKKMRSGALHIGQLEGNACTTLLHWLSDLHGIAVLLRRCFSAG